MTIQSSQVEPWFLEIMPTPITIAPFQKRDLYGVSTWGNPVSYSCHVQYKQRVFVDAGGKQRTARGRAYLPGVYPVSTDDQITLDDGSQPVILNVETQYDDQGPHHTVVHFE